MKVVSDNVQQPRPSGFDVIETGASLGAEVRGLDLRHITSGQAEDIRRIWNRYSVLLFRNQSLSNLDLLNFSRRLGALDIAPIQENGRRFVDDHPELYVVSNVTVNGEAIGSLGSGEAVWHTDMSYLDQPPMASSLYAVEIPEHGGNTHFCCMSSVYGAFPEAMKRRLSTLRIKHDGTYNSGGFVRHGLKETDDPRTSPGAVHPLVCAHPETGRKALYVGRRRNSYIMGLELADSEELLNDIWLHIENKRHAWEHSWRIGDLVLWDNRSTMHRRDPFDASARRIMYRTQIKGDQRPSETAN